MIAIIGTLRFPPEEAASLKPHLETMVAATRAEPGALYFSLAFDPSEPGLVRVSEIFEDMAALEFHRASAHMKAWRAVTGGYTRDLKILDASERA
ncbi:MAG: putative quinol monooxygenase [Hyphomonadaceae bacterium]